MKLTSATLLGAATQPVSLHKVFSNSRVNSPWHSRGKFQLTNKLAFIKGKESPLGRIYSAVPSDYEITKLQLEFAHKHQEFGTIIILPWGRVHVTVNHFHTHTSRELQEKSLVTRDILEKFQNEIWEFIEQILGCRMGARKVGKISCSHRVRFRENSPENSPDRPGHVEELPFGRQVIQVGSHKVEYDPRTGMVVSCGTDDNVRHLRAAWILMWDFLDTIPSKCKAM